MMKNKTIFEYSDFKNPFLKVTVFDENGTKNELLIKFSEYELENGTIIDTESVVARINEAFDKIYPVELLLSCEEIYKSVLSLPKMNKFRAEATYRKQMKDLQRDEYTVIADSFTHSVGCVFNSYFVPNRIVNCLKKIAKDLNTRVETVRLFGMFLKEQLNFKQDYVYFHVREHLCRMLLVVENRLITEYDFCFNTVQDIKRQFLMVASKHEFEFERKRIAFYGVDSDIPLELNLGLKRVDIDEDVYSMAGIEIEYDDDPLEQMTNTKPTTFEERLAACPDYVRKRYEKLWEQICQYEDMKCQLSDVCATFFVKSKVWFKIDIDQKGEGKRISLYIAEDPQKFVKRKIQFAISKKQNFLSTPSLLRISTNSRFALAKQTIKRCMEDNNVALGKAEPTKKASVKFFGRKSDSAKVGNAKDTDTTAENNQQANKFSFGKKPEAEETAVQSENNQQPVNEKENGVNDASAVADTQQESSFSLGTNSEQAETETTATAENNRQADGLGNPEAEIETTATASAPQPAKFSFGKKPEPAKDDAKDDGAKAGNNQQRKFSFGKKPKEAEKKDNGAKDNNGKQPKKFGFGKKREQEEVPEIAEPTPQPAKFSFKKDEPTKDNSAKNNNAKNNSKDKYAKNNNAKTNNAKEKYSKDKNAKNSAQDKNAKNKNNSANDKNTRGKKPEPPKGAKGKKPNGKR